MDKLAMFVPLAKADAAQRLVFGYFDETPDRSREIFDYASSKPNFEAWSESFAKATDGLSVGNIRAQHGRIAAGKLEKIAFDDENRRVEFCAKIVDDNEWAKVEAGVYTGFSPGGRYAKRWGDPQKPGYTRYTAEVSELSIVDVPCNPAATFTMVKADGIEESVEFVLDKAYEPGNEATKERAEVMAKSAGGSWKDHVQQARADLISENAADALAKMAGEPEATEEPAAPALLDSLNAALAKADNVLVVDASDLALAVTPVRVYASALGNDLLKADFDLPVAPPSPEAVALIGADLGKSIAAVEQIRTLVAPKLEKGLYDLDDVVCSLRSFAWITQSVTDEASWEGDNSPLPQMAVDILKALKAFLVALVEEEVSEMLARLKAGADLDLVIEPDEEMALAAQIVDLVKADAARMEKAGARNSKTDAARIQAIHDKAGELGASCASDTTAMSKAAQLEADNEHLTKAVTDALPRLAALTGELETMRAERAADREAMQKMQEQLATIGAQPALTKIEAAAIKAKEDDGLAKSDDTAPASAIEAASTLPSRERTRTLEQIALNAKHT